MGKVFFFTIYSILLVWFVADFSYKRGRWDQIAISSYVEAVSSYTTLYLLRNKSAEEAIEFYESELDFHITIHKSIAENQSSLQPIFKDNFEKPNTDYYQRILEYRVKYLTWSSKFSHPS